MSQQIREIIGYKLPLIAKTDSSAKKGDGSKKGCWKAEAPRAQRALAAGLRLAGKGTDPKGTYRDERHRRAEREADH